MKKFAVHICLVSKQPLPNFLPIFEADFRPQKVILLVTPEMKNEADILASVIKNRCQINNIEQITIDDEYDISLVENELLHLLADYQSDKVAVNITGGTKLMAIAAFNFAQDNGYQCIYFTQNQSEIILFHPKRQPEILLQCQSQKLKIEDYLNLYGFEIKAIQVKPLNIQQWIKQCIEQYDQFVKIIPQLNYQLFKLPNNELLLSLNEFNHYDYQAITALLSDLGTIKQGLFQFDNKENKQFAHGGWFEQFVFNQLKELKKEYPQIQDIALNIEFKIQSDETHNEIDIAVLCNNILYLIECKTVNFEKESGQKQGNDILYKLETLKKTGGLNTQCALISYISTKNKKGNNPIKSRAKSNQIELWAGKDAIRGLKTHLMKWLKLK